MKTQLSSNLRKISALLMTLPLSVCQASRREQNGPTKDDAQQ